MTSSPSPCKGEGDKGDRVAKFVQFTSACYNGANLSRFAVKG